LVNLAVRRPGTGLPPDMLERILGGVSTRPLKAGEPLTLGDVAK
jgi:sialic acid synthase SpsE